MPDTRIKKFTDWWHDYYKEEKGVYPTWNKGKEQKAIQKALKYFDAECPQNPLGEMTECAKVFFGSEEKFVMEREHDVMDFCQKPNKYLLLLKKKRYAQAQRERNKKAIDNGPQKPQERPITGVAFCPEDWLEDMKKDPEGWIKGFKWTAQSMKKTHPESYAKVRELILDFYGKERAKKLWSDAPETLVKSLQDL